MTDKSKTKPVKEPATLSTKQLQKRLARQTEVIVELVDQVEKLQASFKDMDQAFKLTKTITDLKRNQALIKTFKDKADYNFARLTVLTEVAYYTSGKPETVLHLMRMCDDHKYDSLFTKPHTLREWVRMINNDMQEI